MKEIMETENRCICEGNWRNIINETQDLFDRKYLNRQGKECVFVGVVWGSDDFYYGMWEIETGKCALLSCVGSIEEGHGYTLVE